MFFLNILRFIERLILALYNQLTILIHDQTFITDMQNYEELNTKEYKNYGKNQHESSDYEPVEISVA